MENNEEVLWFTKENFEKIKALLEYCEGDKRKEIIDRINTARGFGDLSENSEYDEARAAQRDNEAEILRLKERIQKAKIYENSEDDCSEIKMGLYVSLYHTWNDKTLEYQVVGSGEADPLKRKISSDSPVGQALLGAKVGDEVSVSTPAGVRIYKVMKISTQSEN